MAGSGTICVSELGQKKPARPSRLAGTGGGVSFDDGWMDVIERRSETFGCVQEGSGWRSAKWEPWHSCPSFSGQQASSDKP